MRSHLLNHFAQLYKLQLKSGQTFIGPFSLHDLDKQDVQTLYGVQTFLNTVLANCI